MAIPNRNEVPKELTWDLTRIFKTDQEWEQALQEVKAEVAALPDLEASFTNSGTTLYEGLTQILAIQRKLEKVYLCRSSQFALSGVCRNSGSGHVYYRPSYRTR